MLQRSWLVCRNGTFHFRRVVPDALKQALARRELTCSLGTSDPRVAKLAALRLYLASEQLFSAVRTEPMLSETQLARLVQDFYRSVLEKENIGRLSGIVLNDKWVEARRAYYADVALRTRKALAANRLDEARIVTEAMLRKQRVPLESLTAQDWQAARQAMLRAGIDLSEALQARYAGDFNFEPTDKLLTQSLASAAAPADFEVAETAQEVETPELDPGTLENAQTKAQPSFSELGQKFLEDQVTTRAWEKQSASQARATFRLFCEICGDKPLSHYTRTDAALFRDTLQRLPGDYGKAAAYKGLSATKIVAAHNARSTNARSPLLTAKTIKRHFSALSTLWQAKLPEAEVSENIFSGFRFGPARKAAAAQRDMWEKDELAKLFVTPVWAGSLSASRRSKPGSYLSKDEKFWLPLIAVFSGLRQEEICQLRMGDIRNEEHSWFFDIKLGGDKKLKNSTARRRVPVHPELIRIGLLQLLKPGARPDGLIFPGLKPGGADHRRGHGFAKWFTRYRKDVGLYRSGLDFHSFRHTATTLMHIAGIETAVIDRVTGHVTPGETARYTKTSSFGQLRAAIEAIDIGVRLDHLFS